MSENRSDPRSDQELVEALNRGEASAFEAIYFRYRDWVGRLAQRIVGNENDALDILQETFLYLHRKFPGFELRARLTTFLYPVVKHLALAQRRRRGKFVGDDAVLEMVAARPGDTRREQVEDLQVVVSSLPQTHREVLLMRYVDEMSLEEIAQALSIPLGTVKSRIHNGLKMLAEDPKTRAFFE